MHMRHIEGSEIQLAHTAMHEAGTVLLCRAQAAGQVRPGIELVTVLRLILGMLLANEQSPSPNGVGPMFDILIAGIRTGPRS